MKLKIYAEIVYTIKKKHYKYNDIYRFDTRIWGNEFNEKMKDYITNDLMLVAGGGYSTDGVENAQIYFYKCE